MIAENTKWKWVRKSSGRLYNNQPMYELFIEDVDPYKKFPIARITHQSGTILGISYNIERSPRGLSLFKHSPYKTIKRM